ncbi:VOC family protein [Arenicella xantha]|uniref:Catechol 2,3-dioxygenase-like lactoylglutathione lyase family enzyme n=1 Tax=Arenicella xantha TaxID=644221 RepID=A0A395JME1_9GAMM|nr:VOC family protein [Arenicella xantha]RBP52811.1 catechol 2,3-dioxygenase-like lactoylglutathione lyase family enzyme [Arenicella xantha]
MQQTYLEHTNLTVSNPDQFAELLCRVLGWRIRWSGPALNDGYTVHVGGDQSYLALYAPVDPTDNPNSQRNTGNLNHLGIVVNDLDAIEVKIRAAGLIPFNYRDYEPGRRFYVKTTDDIELELISYNK